ncbi:MAG: hypothetical protein ABIQ30_04040 [Devosia sp.]
MSGFDGIGESAIGELRNWYALVDWTGPRVTLDASSLIAKAGVRVDMGTTVYRDFSIGESALGEVGQLEAIHPQVYLRATIVPAVGAVAAYQPGDLNLTPISIEPIVRNRRTTVRILMS